MNQSPQEILEDQIQIPDKNDINDTHIYSDILSSDDESFVTSMADPIFPLAASVATSSSSSTESDVSPSQKQQYTRGVRGHRRGIHVCDGNRGSNQGNVVVGGNNGGTAATAEGGDNIGQVVVVVVDLVEHLVEQHVDRHCQW